jgi:hypothetical protein
MNTAANTNTNTITNTITNLSDANANATTNAVSTDLTHFEWTTDHEDILIEWADKAMCYNWLHTRAHAMYSKLNYSYTIPVIIISTLTGTANFAQARVPLDYQGYFGMIVGFFNILAGIITTIQQFLKITQLNEAHRVSGIAWDKFYRNIKIEIARHPDERMDVNQLIKISKEEFDRLIETCPDIPDQIINEFKIIFKGNYEYSEIVKPEMCGQLVSTERYRNQWSTSENLAKKKGLKQQREKKLKSFIEKFIDDFNIINGRDPIESEIVDNLKEQLDIEIIKEISSKIFKEKQNEINANNIPTVTEPAKLTKLDSSLNILSMEITDLPV